MARSSTPDRELRDEVKSLSKATKWSNFFMIILTLALVALTIVLILKT